MEAMSGRQAATALPLLQLRDLRVAFGERPVLRGLTLEMRSSCLSVMGHAGAGKSTLLRTLAGLNDAQPELRIQGEALYLGRPLGEGPRPWLVGQKARLLLSNVFENLAQALSRRERMTQAEQRDVVDALVREALGPAAPPLSARVIELPLGVQRCLAIARGIAAGAELVMADEPTAGLSDEGRAQVIDLLRRESRRRGILLVTHHIGDARALGGDVALLVDGRVAEEAPVERLLSAPATAAGRRFVETGTCYFVDEPDTAAAGEEALAGPQALTAGQDLTEGRGPAGEQGVTGGEGEATSRRGGRAGTARGEAAAPAGSKYLHWVLPGRLLGMPRPGVVRDLDEDLETLRQLGVSVVVSLEEARTVPEEALARYGMRGEHLAIEDMGAPSIEEARDVCASIQAHVDAGRVVAVHCLGGAGRTGLVLAAYFIFLGASALDALESVRRVQPRFVQSDVQVAFLSRFEIEQRGKGRAGD